MATYCMPRDPLSWFVEGARRVLLSACTVALVSCGGGQSGPAAPVDSVGPTPAPMPAPGSPPAPAQLVVGTAQSIDSGASGNPVSLRVARSANGDGFAVWKADNGGIVPSGGSDHDLWANRYSAATAAWGSPIRIVAGSTEIEEFDLAVDASGNAVVAWNEISDPLNKERGVVMSARFDTGAGAWATPVPLNTAARFPRVASDATGAVLAAYVVSISSPPPISRVRGRFFDPASGTWQPEAAIEQNNRGTGESFDLAALLDGSGNAFVAFGISDFFSNVASNYYSRNTGSWGHQSDPLAILGIVPFGNFDAVGNVQLAASTDGDFLLAWESRRASIETEIFIAHFTSRTRTWNPFAGALPLVPKAPPQPQRPDGLRYNGAVRLQRIGSDAAGNTLVLWTEGLTEGSGGADTAFDRTRTALRAFRVDQAGATCSAVQVIDGAVGGGAAGADLAVDPQGNAIAIWQQFEKDVFTNDPGNIAINRFDGATGAWTSAVLAETQPGNAISPSASTPVGGQALLGWIQEGGGANRVKVLLQPLTDTPGR